MCQTPRAGRGMMRCQELAGANQLVPARFPPARGILGAVFIKPTNVTRCFDLRCYVVAFAANAKGSKRCPSAISRGTSEVEGEY